MGRKHSRPSDESQLAQAIELSVNVHSVIFARVYFPSHSNSFKEIMNFLGCLWSEPHSCGIDSIVWRHVWEQNQDVAFKRKLIVYNAEDTMYLEVLAQVLSQLKKPQNTLGTDLVNEFVQADTMKRSQHFRWGEGDFSVDAFRSINQASYWDYQRGRVYVRSATNKHRQTVQRKLWTHSWDRTIDFEPHSSACLKCGHLVFRRSGHQQKIVYDLDFRRRGIARRITRFRVIHRSCACCGTRAPVESLPRDKYGTGVVAFLVYHLVDLFVSQEAVVRMLNDLFDMRIQGSGQINPIKARAAEYYRPTYDRLLESIRHGQLLHADETKANIQGKRTYVWVFTSLDEVVYVHSDSREADLPKNMLSEFKGVLVSDFYTAYDAIDCRHQKCLIHLLRDMNTELLNAPFDEELRFVAENFGSLLAEILKTIDRFGLKARFLRRHRKETAQFLDEVLATKFCSESALKFQNRFWKNRDALFTFLELDGIPWNNNNAEHAIKAFARLRNVIRGTSNERGINDYLVLLSICQTCKYMGLDFLDFLRFGQKDIHAFAESQQRRKKRIGSDSSATVKSTTASVSEQDQADS
jgi:hypothetical protein